MTRGGGQSHPKNLNSKKEEERKIERKKQGNFLNPEIMKILKRGKGGGRGGTFHSFTFNFALTIS